MHRMLHDAVETLLIPFGEADGTVEKINAFQQYSVGWHFGEGIAPTFATCNVARVIARELRRHDITLTDAFPGIWGEVRVTGYDGEDYYEFTINGDQSIDFVHQCGDDVISSAESLGLGDVVDKIKKLNASPSIPQWFYTDSSNKSIGTNFADASKTFVFCHQVTDQAYQPFQNSVRLHLGSESAHDFRGIMDETLKGRFSLSPSPIGVSTPKFSLKTPA